MAFRLVDRGWSTEIENALAADHSRVQIVCPFIKHGATERLLKHGTPAIIQIITRLHLADFYSGVSDLGALQLLKQHGAEIRAVKNLHAKVYLLGASGVIVTSANLTDAALMRNHEFGFVADDAEVMKRSRQYFDDLWTRAGQNLTGEQIQDCDRRVKHRLALGSQKGSQKGSERFFGEKGLRRSAAGTTRQVEFKARGGWHALRDEGRGELREPRPSPGLRTCHPTRASRQDTRVFGLREPTAISQNKTLKLGQPLGYNQTRFSAHAGVCARPRRFRSPG